MLCRGNSTKKNKKKNGGSVPVYLNVYDLTPMNGYAYWLGLGVYHSGVEVHGVEYAFGCHEQPTTGIFEGEPKQCDGFTFRKQILIGYTEMSLREVRQVMEELAEEYKGIAYNLITKNCNHFCNDACIRLSGNPIPSWVNRLARIGLLCNCLIPVSLSTTKIGIEEKACEGEKKKLRSGSSSGFLNSSVSSSCSSSSLPSPPDLRSSSRAPTTSKANSTSGSRSRTRSNSRSPLTPSSPLIFSSSPPSNF